MHLNHSDEFQARTLQSNHNAVRRIIDGMHAFAEKIGHVGAKPTKVVSNWVTDKVAPSYWIPNYQILVSFELLRSLANYCLIMNYVIASL